MKIFKLKLINTFAAATFILLSATTVQAQKKAEVGLRFMPTVSSFDMNTSTGGTVKGEATLGLGFGFFLGFNFTEHIGVQGEIIYSSISQKYKEQNLERKVNLRYVNIPLLLSLNTGKSKPVNLNVVAGPQIGLSVGSSVKTTGSDGALTSQAIVSVKKSDLGFAYGAGIDFGINTAKTIRLGLGYRGVLGLVDIGDKKDNLTTESFYVVSRTHLKTNSAYAGLSILF